LRVNVDIRDPSEFLYVERKANNKSEKDPHFIKTSSNFITKV